ncbi:MAG: phosphotriesterase [Bacteroidetes bacterium]|nr:MAG: phosphotriesterase [Bacteroidota bacterium]RLD95722.1 MAG: phosphotriesterase [Bacteroidota bacterium]
MRNISRIFLGLALTGLLSCSPESEQIIMTVLGPIPASAMGITLSHEHILVDFIGADSTAYHRWEKQEVVNKVIPYLEEIQEYQVSTLMECTPAYLGRDPWLLKTLSKNTGMHLVTNTGYYGAHDNLFIPAKFYELTAEELSRIWVDEFENGIEGSGVKPGFIKIAVNGDESLSKEHVKIITAAALTHQQTGLVIASHTGPDGPAFEQISVLQSHGLNPSCFIWVHAQLGSLEGNIRAAKMGTWISLDNLNLDQQQGSKYDVAWYADRIQDLKEAGFLNRVLISHDAGWYKPGEENGGSFRGFTGIFTALVPALREVGFSQEDINLLLEINPRNAFSIRN